MTGFLQLPIEIQQYILEFTVTVENLTSLKLVSKRFKVFVEQVFDHNYSNGKPLRWNLSHKNRQEVMRLLNDERVLLQTSKYSYMENVWYYGDIDLLTSLLKDTRIDPMLDGSRPLFLSSMRGSLSIVKLLLADPRTNLDSDTIFSAMLSACEWNRPQVLKFLLDKYPIDPQQNKTLLGVQNRNIPSGETLYLLISHCSIQLFPLEERKKVYEIAIGYACSFGFSKCLEEILHQKDVLELDVSFGFLRACETRNYQVMKLLLQFARISHGIWTRDIIQKLDSLEIVRLLVQSPNVTLPGEYLEELICRWNDLGLLQVSLSRIDKKRFLKTACLANRVKMVKLLLTHGDLDISSLHYALYSVCAQNHIEIAQLLLSDPRVDPSKTPQILEKACYDENVELLQLLLKHPKVDPSFLGEDVLPYLVESGKTQVTQLLLNDSRIKN